MSTATAARFSPLDRRPSPSDLVALVGLAVIAAMVSGFFWAKANTTYDFWGGLLVAPALIVVSAICLRMARSHVSDAFIMRLLGVAFLAKLVGAYVRFHIAFGVYERADAAAYAQAGRRIAEALRTGILPDLTVTGTPFIDLVTGVVFSFAGSSMLGGFFVFAGLSFLGMYLFYRGFTIAVPLGNKRRYALLLFFLPTMLFWPSSIGKEAWMILTLGISAYGAARVLAGQTAGYVFFLAGVAGVTLVRPHVAAIVCASLVGALLLARYRRRSLSRLVALVIAVAIGGLVLAQTDQFFDEVSLGEGESSGVATVETLLEETERRSSDTGGSVFDNRPVRSPVDLPVAALTVLFRPLPHEAHNTQAFIASLEGVILLLVVLASVPRLLRAMRDFRRTPYASFAMLYVLLFVIAFSNIGNFGILVRQRATLYPFLLILVALPGLGEQVNERPCRDPVKG